MSSSGWEIRKSKSRGVHYFYNAGTGQSVWETPAGMTEEQAKLLPGAENLPGAQGTTASTKPAQVRASHLLVKHRGSRRPSSWKEANITRSKEEAIAILKGYASEINSSPEKFKELAIQHSDCSSHAKGGDLGWFGPGMMQKPFEDAAYGLAAGQISGVVESDSGVHLIMRTG